MLGFKAARSEFVYSVQDSLNEISPSCISYQWLVEHTVSIWVCWNDRDQRVMREEEAAATLERFPQSKLYTIPS